MGKIYYPLNFEDNSERNFPSADFSRGVNLVAQVTDCRQNAVFPAKKEYFSAKSAFVCRGGKAEIESEVLKNGRWNCPYGTFLRLDARFRAAKTGFLC